MAPKNQTKALEKLFSKFNFESKRKYKLVVLIGLLGDFDSVEYAQNLSKFLKSKKAQLELDLFIVGIGKSSGKEKFCQFTGIPEHNIEVVLDNELHNLFGSSKGIDIGMGGWVNMILMLAGIGSPKTLKEVFRGYSGDKNGVQIYKDSDVINLLNIFKFSGDLFRKSFGHGYLRPFELATFRLNNLFEIIKNWNDYIIDSKYLPQRVSTFLLNEKNEILYKHLSKDILNYSRSMENPLLFLSDYM